MEYKILTESGPFNFMEKVNAHLAEGWQLAGGVAVSIHDPGLWVYVQAMTRAKEPAPSH
jgi:hypothetical protein